MNYRSKLLSWRGQPIGNIVSCVQPLHPVTARRLRFIPGDEDLRPWSLELWPIITNSGTIGVNLENGLATMVHKGSSVLKQCEGMARRRDYVTCFRG